MSIKVKDISKFYGEQKALDQVSFEINKGEIVGFLGPNGAGKSTMMKILTTYLKASEGEAEVCGLSVSEEDQLVKEKVGYLPEHNPLYLEMYVTEYLQFVAGLHKANHDKVEEIIEKTGLSPERHKQIGELSKGYRQRVGLAQALLHEPEVLILDEPTTGLDPNQIVEIRKLIMDVGKEKTVLFSSHIMQEVEAVCSRVIIINKGKIVADKPVSELKNLNKKQQVLVVEFDGLCNREDLLKIDGVESAERLSDNEWKLTSSGKTDLRKATFKFAVDNDLSILQQQVEKQNLEKVFQELTNKL